MRPSTKDPGFTLIEVMVVIAIIGIIVAIGLTTWLRQREAGRARACQENLTKIEHAKEQYAMDPAVARGATPTWDALVGETLYIKRTPTCPAVGTYSLNPIDLNPTCSYTLPDYMNEAKYYHEVKD